MISIKLFCNSDIRKHYQKEPLLSVSVLCELHYLTMLSRFFKALPEAASVTYQC